MACVRCKKESCNCSRSFCKKRRYEISTRGLDETFEGIGSDPYAGQHGLGITIPSPLDLTTSGRLLFLLAIAEFPKGPRARLVGIRQYVELEADVLTQGGCTYAIRRPVESLSWHPPDGGISWHVRKINIGRVSSPRSSPANRDGLSYLMAEGPSLLFATPPPAYKPPNGGIPYGEPLHPDLATFYDLRFPWTTPELEMSIPIRGDCAVAIFASVLPTDPRARCSLAGSGVPITSPPLVPEDVFLNTPSLTNARYGRIAASLIFEDVYS